MRLVLINLFLFVVLLLGANVAAGIWLDLSTRFAAMDGADDSRASSPAYQDRAVARKIFRDFYRTKSAYSSFEAMRLEPFSSETTNIDADGLRITPGGPVNPTEHLTFFGGSTMWGTGVDDAHTIPALVQQRFPLAAVVNHGQSGFVSGENVAALLKRIALGRPIGTAVFYDGINDVFHLCQGRNPLDGHPFTYFLTQATRNYRDQQLGISERAWAATLGNLRDLAGHWAGADIRRTIDVEQIPPSRCLDSAAVDLVADILWRNWRSAKTLVEANGRKFIAILQPVSSVGAPKRDYLPPQPEWDVRYKQAYARLRERISAEGRGWAYDLSNAFDGADPLYIDPFHVSERGNEIIADRVAPMLRP
jgi:lysophospholipase L1-like esterase